MSHNSCNECQFTKETLPFPAESHLDVRPIGIPIFCDVERSTTRIHQAGPLIGGGGRGGSKASFRKRREAEAQSQITPLRTAMAAMLSAMQSTAVHQNAKQNSRASVQNKAKPKPKQSRAGEEDIPIVSRIRSLLLLIDQGHKSHTWAGGAQAERSPSVRRWW